MPSLVTSGSAAISPLFVLAFLYLSLAVGRRVLRLLDVPSDGSVAERAVIAAALGSGLLQFVPYALGAAGLLGVTPLRLALSLVALAAIPDLAAVARRGWAAPKRWQNPEGWVVAWALVLSPGLIVIALLALTPTIDPDGLTYHLLAPKRWLASGFLSYLPTYFPTNGPMGVEMLFAIAMVFGGDIAAKCLHCSLGLVGAAGLYLAGRRQWGGAIGALAVTLYLAGPIGVGLTLGWAYVEGATAFTMTASILAWLLWFREHRPGWLRCSFLLAGMAVSFKITAVLFPLALGGLTLVASWEKATDWEHPLLTALAQLGWLVLLVAAPIVPWLVRSAILTGNPLFPLFASFIPSRDLSPAMAANYERFNRYLNWGSSAGANWDLQQRKLILYGVAIAFLVVGAIVIVRLCSRVARGFALVLLVTTVGQLLAAGLYLRYWMPLFSVLQLPILGLFQRTLSGRSGRAAVIALTLLASVMQARRGLGSIENDVAGLVRTAAGIADRRIFLQRHLPLLSIYEQANRELPANSRIVLNDYCGGFYLDRTTFCFDFPQEALRSTTWGEFVADLRRLGITHVITVRTLANGGPFPPLNSYSAASAVHEGRNNEQLARLLTGRSRLVAAAADQGLYELDMSTLR